MTLGKADINCTGLGFLMFGHGYQHLYFKPRRESRDAPRPKKVKVLDYQQAPSCFSVPSAEPSFCPQVRFRQFPALPDNLPVTGKHLPGFLHASFSTESY